MSYIPKYILKRMIPKEAVTIQGDDIVVSMTNVISPISIDEVPDKVLEYIVLKIDDKVIIDAANPDLAKTLKLGWEDKVFTLNNFKDACGLTLPVGGKLTIGFKNPGLKKGETHDFEVTIKTDNPINIKFDREVM
jgi:hypothetical protein